MLDNELFAGNEVSQTLEIGKLIKDEENEEKGNLKDEPLEWHVLHSCKGKSSQTQAERNELIDDELHPVRTMSDGLESCLIILHD